MMTVPQVALYLALVYDALAARIWDWGFAWEPIFFTRNSRFMELGISMHFPVPGFHLSERTSYFVERVMKDG